MKKTISINLGSSLFYAEDDAYRRLDDYLREVERYFSAHGDDSAEILRDIESSLAEQFINSGAGELKRALSLAEVEAALKNMGTITDFSADDQNVPAGENNIGEKNRRFYRDGDDVIVAGVCSGLGHYFGIDPVWVRLIFAASVFFWGFGVWIYIIIWIAAPSAKTAAQKLAMQGEAVNLSSLSAKLKDNLQAENIKRAGSGFVSAFENFLKKLFSLFGRILRSILRLLAVLLSLAVIFFSLFAFCASAFLGVAAIFSGRQYLEPGLASALGWPYPWLAASSTLAFALPFLALFMLGLMMIRKKNFLPAVFWLSLLGLWFVSFLCAGAIGSAAYARVRPYVNEQRSENIALAGEMEKLEISGPYYLQIVPGEVLSLQAQGHPADLADIEASLVDGKLNIGKKPSRDWVCFNCGHSVRLTLSVPPSFKEASVGDRAVLNLEAWQGEELKLSFSGSSGGNISANLKTLRLLLSDMADVDLVGGNLEKLLIEADDYSSFDSGRAVVLDAEASLAGASRISINAKESIKAIFDPSAEAARLFYNPDLKKLEVEGGSSSQLRLLGQEDDPEISLVPGNVGVYSVNASGEDSDGQFSVSGLSAGQMTVGTVTTNSALPGKVSFGSAAAAAGDFKVVNAGEKSNVGSFRIVNTDKPLQPGTITVSAAAASSTEIQDLPAAAQIKISAPVRP